MWSTAHRLFFGAHRLPNFLLPKTQHLFFFLYQSPAFNPACTTSPRLPRNAFWNRFYINQHDCFFFFSYSLKLTKLPWSCLLSSVPALFICQSKLAFWVLCSYFSPVHCSCLGSLSSGGLHIWRSTGLRVHTGKSCLCSASVGSQTSQVTSTAFLKQPTARDRGRWEYKVADTSRTWTHSSGHRNSTPLASNLMEPQQTLIITGHLPLF